MSMPAPRLLRLADFLNRPRPRWLVDGLLPAAEMAVLSGAYASGKSFVALELAGCITQGREFAGRTVRQGRVLYLVAEGCAGTRDRLYVLEQEGRVDRENLVVSDTACQIGNQAERQALQAKLEEMNFKPDLIIVDTLARHAVGVEENSAKDMGVWIASVEALAQEFGCAVLLLHHVGKTERRGMRGSSALSGAISTSIICQKHGDLVTLTCDKQKDADEFAPFSFRARKVRHAGIESLVLDHIDGGTPNTDRLKPDEVAILSALQAAFPRSVMRGDFKKRSNGSAIPESSFDRAIKRLIDLGHAERIGQGEYLLCNSPSPNDPQRSPMGIASTPEKSPPSPPPYRGGDVGVRGQVSEVKVPRPQPLPVVAINEMSQYITVPKFVELTTWPRPDLAKTKLLN